MLDSTTHLDCVIFGGGVAGLFALDATLSDGFHAALLESDSLGSGQTIDSQGIIHGGLKYAITGSDSHSADAIRQMPLHWRRCLAGESLPDLQTVAMRAQFCHLWRTDSIRSRLGWLAAKFALQTQPQLLDKESQPNVFQGVRGSVARLDEQVIEPRSLLEVLGHQLDQHLLQTVSGGVEISRLDDGWLIQLLHPDSGDPVNLKAKHILLTAGSGNASLRETLGLEPNKTQSRPLHMVMARGNLPIVNGHCIDGARTRVTITTTQDYANRSVWQIGGHLAEVGVEYTQEDLVSFAIEELHAVLPNVQLQDVEFQTYMTNRAEQNTHGSRPDDICILEEDNVLTCWPTKLAFAPRLANEITVRLGKPSQTMNQSCPLFDYWPSPTVALPPWETDQPWITSDMVAGV